MIDSNAEFYEEHRRSCKEPLSREEWNRAMENIIQTIRHVLVEGPVGDVGGRT